RVLDAYVGLVRRTSRQLVSMQERDVALIERLLVRVVERDADAIPQPTCQRHLLALDRRRGDVAAGEHADARRDDADDVVDTVVEIGELERCPADDGAEPIAREAEAQGPGYALSG